MSKIKLIILRNEIDGDHDYWIQSCEKYKKEVEYRIVNIALSSWFEDIQSSSFDWILTKPSNISSQYKQLYDERLEILHNLNYKIFPTYTEVKIYENKRYLSYWLKANDVPHPKSFVFYSKKEAKSFVKKQKLPIVGKINIGASGRGVKIFKEESFALNYIDDCFSKGIRAFTGPNLSKGNKFKRFITAIKNPKYLVSRLKIYHTVANDLQKGFVFFQEYIKHDFEWRVVRIGESYFAHQKMVHNEKASGTLIKGYINPPLSLLDFVKEITDKHNFKSQAVDVFEKDGSYLVNEIQCIFGQSDPYQMLVNNKPGRFVFENNQWIFEEGMFNTNKSYDLRLETIISMHNANE